MGVSDRARETLPTGLEIQKSGIPDAGLMKRFTVSVLGTLLETQFVTCIIKVQLNSLFCIPQHVSTLQWVTGSGYRVSHKMEPLEQGLFKGLSVAELLLLIHHCLLTLVGLEAFYDFKSEVQSIVPHKTFIN